MLKSIVAGTTLVFAMSASALPNGKPPDGKLFQEIAAELSAIDAEIAGIQQRIADGDAALADAIAVLAELVAANSDSISTRDDVLAQLAIETSDLATAVGTTNEALASLALDMAEQIAEREAADQALAARLEVLEAIDHARVTGQCLDGSVLLGRTETSITCAAMEQSSDPLVYRKNAVVSATVPSDLVVHPQCDNASDRSYNGGFLASPNTATVSESFLQFGTDLPTRHVRALNATSLVGYIVCERAAQ